MSETTQETTTTTATTTEPTVEDKIRAMVDEQVAGLKKTNEELKSEKIKIAQQLDQFSTVINGLGGLEALKSLGGAETVKRMVEMKSRFEKDEQGKLLTEGKYDEWFDRRTEALRKDHTNQLTQLQSAAEEERKLRESAETALRRKVLEVEVSQACVDEKVEASAYMDVQLRAQNAFVYDDDRKRLIIRDQDGGIQFGKDGKSPKTIREWLAEQKDVSRHWWPSSKGSGAGGSNMPGEHKQLATLDFREYMRARKAEQQ
jgi:hypothetical protein